MTGKDFSGPTPEIRPPPVLTLAETEGAPSNSAVGVKKQSQTPLPEDDGEEVLGDISSYE
jgi:transcription factor TFIIIB component B''